jgi:hypothetical protein
MSDERMLDDAELDAVTGGDGPLLPSILSAINEVFGTNFHVPVTTALPGGTCNTNHNGVKY